MGDHKVGRNTPVEDTGWQRPTLVNTPEGPKGIIVPATGLETNPCNLCRSFESDDRKLRQYWKSHGLTPDAEGYYVTPIAKEIAGRKSMRVHPRDYGYCRRFGYTTGRNATCEDFAVTQTRAELALKIRRR